MSAHRAQKVCAFCGKRRELTKDHVPPRCLFPEGFRQNLIVVGACKECNLQSSQDDAYLQSLLVSDADLQGAPQVQALQPTFLRSLARPQARGFANTFWSTFQNIDMVTPSGLYLSTRKGFTVDAPRLRRIMAKIVKGLFFHEFGRRLPSSHDVLTWFGNTLRYAAPPKNFDTFLNQLRHLIAGSKLKEVGGDTFSYRYNVNPDARLQSFWLLRFYRTREFLAWTLGKKELAKRRLG
jgi:hypothetical protein